MHQKPTATTTATKIRYMTNITLRRGRFPSKSTKRHSGDDYLDFLRFLDSNQEICHLSLKAFGQKNGGRKIRRIALELFFTYHLFAEFTDCTRPCSDHIVDWVSASEPQRRLAKRSIARAFHSISAVTMRPGHSSRRCLREYCTVRHACH